MKRPMVFISYAHADEAWKDELVEALGDHGLDVWDDSRIEAGDPWHVSIHRAIDASQAAVCLITPSYLESEYIRNTEIPAIRSRRAGADLAVVPILVQDCEWRGVEWLSPTQIYPPDGRSLAEDFQDWSDGFFRGVAEGILAKLSADGSPSVDWREPLAVDLEHFRRPQSAAFGRERLFDVLDSALNSPNSHVVSLVGSAGVGKSTVIGAWLERLRPANYRYAERVYAWSFEPDGAGEVGPTVDTFADELFRWLGEEPPSQASPWERGNRLAALLRRVPTLLILDDVPIQAASGAESAASIQDPTLARMLTELARDNRCLVVTASQRTIQDLEPFHVAVRLVHLDTLSPRAGGETLRELGLTGGDLEDLSENFGNHSLALSLVAGYLRGIPAGEIEDVLATIPPYDPALGVEGHPRRVMRAFEERFGAGPEVQLLGAIGLFEGRCGADAMRGLRAAAIPGATDRLAKLSQEEWSETLSRLRRARLVMPVDGQDPEVLDAHPLVRTHFRELLRSSDEKAWRSGNEFLFRHFSEAAPARPNTLEGMQPLYLAVRHGCEAGLHQEVLDEVFWKRILRKNRHFSWSELGLIQSDLNALSHFFTRPWTDLVDGISDEDAGFVVGQAAICLGMSGRLRETVPLLRRSVDDDRAVGHLANASVTSGNLSHVLLTLGEISGSIEAAERSVEFADRSGDTAERVISRTYLANALHRASRFDEAEEQFVEAENIQREIAGQPLLYAGQGLEYGDLLIARGRWSDAQARSLANLARGGDERGRDQDLLAAARADLAGVREGGTGHPGIACRQAESALECLRERGQMDALPLGLLTRAEVYRFEYRQHEALDDIGETLALCRACEMRLHEADALALQAQILAELGKRNAASEALNRARALTGEMGYRAHESALARLRFRLADGGPA